MTGIVRQSGTGTTRKIAVITGVTGQDGSYLAEMLLDKGYDVHGIVRHSSTDTAPRLAGILSGTARKRLYLHAADLSDVTRLRRIVAEVQPDEFYHLAGQSHVGLSFDIPESTCDFTAMGTLRILEILRDMKRPARFLNIASSEVFGSPDEVPQNEATPVKPVSPYGVAKAFSRDITRVYREAFGLFACNAICYNHESPRRGPSFVTRKIAASIAAIERGETDHLVLGNLHSARDWGYALEYVRAMWLMLQQDEPDDFVLATGVLSPLSAFLEHAFGTVGRNWRDHVRTDPSLQRPSEPQRLVGDPSKAAQLLGWRATTMLPELARIMVRAELDAAPAHVRLIGAA